MDTLTHALNGALLARATARGDHETLSLRQRTLAGFFAAAFPDCDYLLRLSTGDFITYLNYHRGATHSVLLLPLWALLLAWLFSKLFRGKHDWKAFYNVSCLGLGVHIAGDVITSYGTMILAPFSDWRASIDTTFIIDPYFSGILLFGLMLSLIRRHERYAAMFGMGLLVGYIGVQAWAHSRAIDLGVDAARAHLWKNARVSTMPQPLSPFNWKIIVEHRQHYHVGIVNLFGNAVEKSHDGGFFNELAAAYPAPGAIDWQRRYRYGDDRFSAVKIRAAWQSDAIADFRRFARFPVFTGGGDADDPCYHFGDLRFELPGRTGSLFKFSVCGDHTDA
jgi:inner membrane protein